jgi:putative oxidoreductase
VDLTGEPRNVIQDLVEAVGGILLLAGLWTPIAGLLLAANEVSIGLLRPFSSTIHILLAVMAAGLAMLGPGAWSVDARLYGRKRLNIRSSSGER